MTATHVDVRGVRGVPRPDALPLRHVERCMGTVFSFAIAAPGVARRDLLLVLAWLHDMDAMFSTYRANSEVSRLRRGELDVADASPEVHEVLDACERYRHRTDGWFDARYDGNRVDPSGYVKGWAVQRASEMLAAAGSVNHCVNGGGDVVCAGRPAPDRPVWRIGISDPHRHGALVRIVAAPGPVAVATSGLAERGAHILDPHTGRAVRDVASVSIVADDLITADVYATAAAAMGAGRARQWLRDEPVSGAVLVTGSGQVIDLLAPA